MSATRVFLLRVAPSCASSRGHGFQQPARPGIATSSRGGHLVLGRPTVRAAGALITHQLQRRHARVGATLDVRTRRRHLALAEAVLVRALVEGIHLVQFFGRWRWHQRLLSADGDSQSNEEPTDNLHCCETSHWVLEWSSLPSDQVVARLDVVGVSLVDVCTLRFFDCQGVVAADHGAVRDEWYFYSSCRFPSVCHCCTRGQSFTSGDAVRNKIPLTKTDGPTCAACTCYAMFSVRLSQFTTNANVHHPGFWTRTNTQTRTPPAKQRASFSQARTQPSQMRAQNRTSRTHTAAT